MAKEIKTLNVDNDQEEKVIKVFQSFGWELKSSQRVYNQDSYADGAITYEDVTFIHNTTETVDFTKLVFEREKKMPHYDELVELEREFWRTAAKTPTQKPYLPPHAETMEDWGRHFEPDLRSSGEKNRHNIIFGVLLAIWFIIFAAFESTTSSFIGDNALAAGFIILGAALIISIWIITYKHSYRKALEIALKPHPSPYRFTLEEEYNAIIFQITAYENGVQYMSELLQEAEEYLD